MTKKVGSEIAIPNVTTNLKTLVNLRYRTLSLLSDYFPIILANEAEVPGVVGRCPHCNKHIMKAMFKGELRKAPDECYRVTAIGWCLDCDILSPFLFHIVPYGPTFIIQGLTQRGWPEAYEHKTLPFAKPKKKRRKVVIKVADGSASFPEKFLCESANSA